MAKKDKSKAFILWFDEIGIEDVPFVGGKNASLGEMYTKLSAKGVKVPYGFAVTAYAYKYFIKENHLQNKIKEVLKGLDTKDVEDLQKRGKKIRNMILRAKMPPALEEEIIKAYKKLGEFYKMKNPDVAVRSSATAEDLPDASFAGQQESYLNIKGPDQLIKAIQKCFASLFTDRAISYREDKGFDHFSVYLSIAVQKMVRSDKASSGVMFTLDTETGFRDVVYITAIWGLGEAIVQGKVNPDEYYVFKPTLKKGYKAIISKKLGDKHMKMVYGTGKCLVKTVKTTKEERLSYALSDEEILKLAEWGMIIEEHYGKPMDIEWAKDGDGKTVGTGELFIVQARPETVHSFREVKYYEIYKLKEEGEVICTGKAVGNKIGQGKANVILSVKDINKFREGEVLVTEMTDPDWEPIMKKAAAIVTERGGRTCHAAIISRELGIPCIVGAEGATKKIETGDEITVDCSKGEIGYVYKGLVPFEVEKIDLEKIPKTRTKIMMNVGIPEQAFAQAQIPNDGVGLARIEFVIGSHIGIHPLALLNYEELKEKAKKDKEIEKVVKVI